MGARTQQESALDGVLGATIDTILAFATVWLVLTVLVTRTTALTGSPVSAGTLGGVVALVAAGCTYPFVSGSWSLRRWLRFVGTAAVVFLGVTVLAFLVLLAIGGIPTDSTASRLLQFGVVAVSLVGAATASVLGGRVRR